MITGELKRQIDALWTEFWQGGITNPLTVIEQVTFLMFTRLLDINETRDENRMKHDMDEDHPLMIAPLNRDVPRTGKALAEAMSLLLKSAKKVRFIDRYFDIKDDRYKETLKALLFVIAENDVNDVCCEIHFQNHQSRPSAEYVEQNAGNWLAGVIPKGMSVRTFVWQEKKGGADFHARYLLTDLGGMSVDAGFSAEGAHQTVLLSLLSHDLHGEKLSAFERNSTEYQLIEPVLEISSTGKVQQI